MTQSQAFIGSSLEKETLAVDILESWNWPHLTRFYLDDLQDGVHEHFKVPEAPRWFLLGIFSADGSTI